MKIVQVFPKVIDGRNKFFQSDGTVLEGYAWINCDIIYKKDLNDNFFVYLNKYGKVGMMNAEEFFNQDFTK